MDEEKVFREVLERQLKAEGICPLCGKISNVVRAVTTIMKQEKVFDYIMDLDHYPTWGEVLTHFGSENAADTERLLARLLAGNDIILDGDEILVTRVTSEKQREMLRKSVRVR